jgi:SAM-dependent methyltransferase
MNGSTSAAEYFDGWYSRLAGSAAHRDFPVDTLGLPPEVESTSLLPWDGIADVVAALALRPDHVLLDLGCGRGGYGLEIARRTGARLLGVDFSAVAIERARENAVGADAEFTVGDLTDTGLQDGTVDAIMSVDAMQFADPYPAGIAECRRVLLPGGRLVLTGWQAVDLADEQVPVRLRNDIAAVLTAGGFTEVRVLDMPMWRAAERVHWERAAALDPGGDAALESLHEEGSRVLPILDRTRRVLATGRKPLDS